jgi:hypothetical protein
VVKNQQNGSNGRANNKNADDYFDFWSKRCESSQLAEMYLGRGEKESTE